MAKDATLGGIGSLPFTAKCVIVSSVIVYFGYRESVDIASSV
jgi:hypothetical protein